MNYSQLAQITQGCFISYNFDEAINGLTNKDLQIVLSNIDISDLAIAITNRSKQIKDKIFKNLNPQNIQFLKD